MNAHTFDTHASVCPICHRPGVIKPHKLLKGLLTCQNCRERLVVSWSGHYVRDPFTLSSCAAGHRLRRESRPFARMRRDFKPSRLSVVWTVLGSALFMGTALFLMQTVPIKQKPLVQPATPLTSTERSPNQH